MMHAVFHQMFEDGVEVIRFCDLSRQLSVIGLTKTGISSSDRNWTYHVDGQLNEGVCLPCAEQGVMFIYGDRIRSQLRPGAKPLAQATRATVLTLKHVE